MPRTMSDNLTMMQSEVLSYMRWFFKEEDRMPSTREIGRAFGWKSQNNAIGHLRALGRKGALEHRTSLLKDNGWWRFPREWEDHEPVREELIHRITEYLAVGGLFNPECMEHEKVRDMVIDCREFLMKTKPKN